MRKLMSIALAVAAIGGAALATTSPASAQDWRNRGDYRGSDQYRDYRDHRDNRDGYRYERGYHPPRYEYRGNGCSTYWHWSDRRGEYVRTDRCRR